MAANAWAQTDWHDLVSYHARPNEQNGHGNTDGTEHNLSWDCGWESVDDPLLDP